MKLASYAALLAIATCMLSEVPDYVHQRIQKDVLIAAHTIVAALK